MPGTQKCARVLAAKPDVLFCDEATSALDPQTTRSILALIRELHGKPGITVALITHQMEVIRAVCREVAVMDRGRDDAFAILEQDPGFLLPEHRRIAAVPEKAAPFSAAGF